MNYRSHIVGTGSIIPDLIKTNLDFGVNTFYDADHNPIESDSGDIARKLQEITGIS